MPSQFFGLNIAYTGLLASNAAMNTTSNNIANVQTEGYSRQQVTQQAANALRVFQTYGCAGAGVETLAIERVRDEFYDGRYWDNNALLGEYDMKQYYMQQLETYFDDDGKSTGFKTNFDQLMITGLQALLKDPNSATAKSQFVGYAGALTEYFNGMAGNLEKVQKDINQEIKLKVDQINSLAGEIASSVFCFIAVIFLKDRYKTEEAALSKTPLYYISEGIIQLAVNYRLALPITANHVCLHLMQSFEAVLLPMMLITCGSTNEQALATYGVLTGMTMPLVLFPPLPMRCRRRFFPIFQNHGRPAIFHGLTRACSWRSPSPAISA